MRSFDHTKPKADLGVKAKNVEQHESADYEIYDFEGDYVQTDNGDHFARVRIDELHSEFDLAEIGDYAAVNYGATIQTHLFEDRILKADRLKIGEGASVGNMAVVLYDTEMQLGSSIAPLSVLMKGDKLPPLTRWYGIPTQPMPDTAANVTHGVLSSEA